MKKKTKKLVLTKETVRELEAGKLQEVHAGICLSAPALSCTKTNLSC